MNLKNNLFLSRQINLQLFAAEDEGKTEQPTQRRLREARRQGRIAKTPELAAAFTLLAGSLWLMFSAKNLFRDFKILLTSLLDATGKQAFDTNFFYSFLSQSGKMLIINILPLLIIVFIVSALAEILQVGIYFSFEPLKPSFDKISFTWEKLKRKILFSRPVMIGLVKTTLKLLIIGFITFFILSSSFKTFAGLMGYYPDKSVVFMGKTVSKLLLWVSVFFIVVAIFDFFYQRFEFIESQKMTKHELKRELIEDEGNPLYKRMIMDKFREILSRRRMLENVPKADVVVTNPTHYAVALKYNREDMNAPKVLAKGEDLFALKIREIAIKNNVPVKEDRVLAKLLYEQTEVGQEIPENLYNAVATVLAYVYNLKEKAG